jgi:hypothetical protein
MSEDYSDDGFDDYPDDFDESIVKVNDKNGEDVIHIIKNESLDDDDDDITKYLFDNNDDDNYDDETFEKEPMTSLLTKMKPTMKPSNSNNQICSKNKFNKLTNKPIKFTEEEIDSLSDSDDDDFHATINSVLQKGHSIKANKEFQKNSPSIPILEGKVKSTMEESPSQRLKNKEKIISSSPILSNHFMNKSEVQSLSSPIADLINKHNESKNTSSSKKMKKSSILKNNNELKPLDKVISSTCKYKVVYGGGIAIRKSPSKNSEKTDIVINGNSIFEAMSTLVVDSIKYAKVNEGWIPERIGDVIILELVKLEENEEIIVNNSNMQKKIVQENIIPVTSNKSEIQPIDKVIANNFKYKVVYGGGIAIRKSPSKNSEKTDIVINGYSIFEAISTLVVDSIKYAKVNEGWIPERIGDVIILELVKLEENIEKQNYSITQVKDNTYKTPTKPAKPVSTEDITYTKTTINDIPIFKATNEELKINKDNKINVIDTTQKLDDSTEELINKLNNIHDKSVPNITTTITPANNISLPLKTETVVEGEFSFADLIKDNEKQSNKNDVIEDEFSFADMVKDDLMKSTNTPPSVSKLSIVNEVTESSITSPVKEVQASPIMTPINETAKYEEDNFESLSPLKLNIGSSPIYILDTNISKDNSVDDTTVPSIRKNDENFANTNSSQIESNSIPIMEPLIGTNETKPTESITKIPQIVIKIQSLDKIGLFFKEKFPRGGIEIIVQTNILGITNETKIVEFDSNLDMVCNLLLLFYLILMMHYF